MGVQGARGQAECAAGTFIVAEIESGMGEKAERLKQEGTRSGFPSIADDGGE